jgi:RimJ/RimL family protein N-acetyltransferase
MARRRAVPASHQSQGARSVHCLLRTSPRGKESDGPPDPAGCREMSDEVRLRDVEPDDLPIFYEQQLDGDATRMAAFPARDRAAFDAHWATNILGNPAAVIQTILLDGQVAGHIGSWRQDGVRLVGYWIGKEHWGKGVATRALAAFLHLVTERPLHAHVARHNVASIRVLEKCGFSGEREESVESGGKDVAELVLVLR